MPTFENKKEAFSVGFDHGNYGAAYESEDWESWYADNCEPLCSEFQESYKAGLILGFHSSLEIHEIADPDVAKQVEALRADWGEV